ncbi:MAG: hypothetical protein AAFQ67_00755 [Pseudomonadota bacterium]
MATTNIASDAKNSTGGAHEGYRNPEWHRRRLAVGWAIADNGGSLVDFAKAEGVSKPALIKWLRASGRDELRRKLRDNARTGGPVPASEARRRLIAAVESPSTADAARALGLSWHALNRWLGANAPDGAANALLDYEEEAA